jgi:hypothetical protein
MPEDRKGGVASDGAPTATSAPRWRTFGRRVLREPLTHFAVIGVVLFAVSAWGDRQPTEAPGRIVISEGDLRQMLFAWKAQGRADPTPAEWQAMLAEKVHEQVLYREALAMGLDQDDTIVTRRLAQKMDFLAEDLSALREPTTDELRAWLEAHPADFALPPRISFHHVYFSPDKHGRETREAAIAALGSGRAASGDRFMFQNSYSERLPDEVAGVFGPGFAQAVFALQPGTWSGPIESGLGWHLVYADSLIPGRAPDLSEVRDQVKAGWMAAQREVFKEEAYKVMRAKYEVILPDLDAVEAPVGKGS